MPCGYSNKALFVFYSPYIRLTSRTFFILPASLQRRALRLYIRPARLQGRTGGMENAGFTGTEYMLPAAQSHGTQQKSLLRLLLWHKDKCRFQQSLICTAKFIDRGKLLKCNHTVGSESVGEI